MTPAKWLWIAVAAILTFLIWLGLYYRDIQISHWTAESDAKERIVATGELAEVEDLHQHIWDETTWIGFGKDDSDTAKYVFLRSDETALAIPASDVWTEVEIKARFRESRPEAELIRLQPGIFRGSPVWEIYYSSTVDGVNHHYYDFYSFDQEGRLIETYLLP